MIGIDDAIAAGLKVFDKFIPDPALKAQVALELEREITARRAQQTSTNQEEIKSGSLLGKWRGFLGWGLACSAVYQLMVQPFLVFLILAFQPTFPVEKLPKLEWQQLGSLLLGMLGLGS